MSGRPSRTSTMRAAVATVLVLTATLAWAQPGRLTESQRGEALTAAQVDARTAGRFRFDEREPPTVRSGVDVHLLRFETRNEHDEPVEGLAHLFVPHDPVDAGAVHAFAPGSSGLVDACAPSLPYLERGELASTGSYVLYGLAWAGQGMPTVVPTYTGFFDPDRLQPYFVADAEAYVVLDALRAAATVLEGLDPELTVRHAFASGFSQGGHAAFAAADRVEDYAPDVPLAGVAGFGPSGEVDVVLRAFPYVAPWIFVAYEQAYGRERIDPAALLQEPYASRLADDVERLCILETQTVYPGDPAALLEPELAASLEAGRLAATHPELYALVKENRTGVRPHGLPAIVLQGVDDPVAPLEDQHRFVARLCDLGSSVRYPNYARTRHETRYLGFDAALEWMRDRVAGSPAPSDCDAVPR